MIEMAPNHQRWRRKKNLFGNFNAIAYLFDQKEENNEKTTNELIAFRIKMWIQSEIKNGILLPTIYFSSPVVFVFSFFIFFD